MTESETITCDICGEEHPAELPEGMTFADVLYPGKYPPGYWDGPPTPEMRRHVQEWENRRLHEETLAAMTYGFNFGPHTITLEGDYGRKMTDWTRTAGLDSGDEFLAILEKDGIADADEVAAARGWMRTERRRFSEDFANAYADPDLEREPETPDERRFHLGASREERRRRFFEKLGKEMGDAAS